MQKYEDQKADYALIRTLFKILENILRILQQISCYISLTGFASFAYSIASH